MTEDLGWMDTLTELRAIARGERDCARCGERGMFWTPLSEESARQFDLPADSVVCTKCWEGDL